MTNTREIVNRVSSSQLVTFNLEDYYQEGERVLLDISDQLFQGLLLREKDFRDFVKNNDWAKYQGKFVAITCSTDAIVPTWAFMLLGIALEPFAKKVVFGTLQDLEIALFREALTGVDWSSFQNLKVVVKGCSKVDVPAAVYVDAVMHLKPLVNSLMFGEPCSTVPLFKISKR